jgi:hypothetical protein
MFSAGVLLLDLHHQSAATAAAAAPAAATTATAANFAFPVTNALMQQ